MIMKKNLYSLFFLLSLTFYGQDSTYLMQLGNQKVSPQEFELMYTKNLDLIQDPTQKDIDNYLQLFIKYKLELADAYDQKFDQDPQLKRELATYRKDLSKKYLSDNAIINQLVKEAYNRMKTDVHVAHILVKVAPDASPADTLKAYNKIMMIYKKAQQDIDFGQLAQQYSEDPSAKMNKGDLDYINAFHTVYPFETAAYQTPVGKISKPFRTKYGYHIIKVLDKRPARGEVEVAHIMTVNHPDKKNELDAKTRIFQIYSQLQNNEDSFKNLARKFSDDKHTAINGGRLHKFGIRQMIPSFENQAFNLKNPGDISQPFQTKYGWHIIKLIRKYPVLDFDQVKNLVHQKVLRDERSKMGRKKLIEKLNKELQVKITGNLDIVTTHINRDFFVNKWHIPQTPENKKVLFVINNDKKVTYRDFYQYLYTHQKKNPDKYPQKKAVISKAFERFKENQLFDYYNHHLEQFYPEFAQIMNEYKHGLMLYAIKKQQIWDKAEKDSLGLKKYYQQHRKNYMKPETFDVLLVQTSNHKTAKKIAKDLTNGHSKKEIEEKYQKEGVITKEKTYTDETLPVTFDKNKNWSLQKEGKQYVLYYLTKTHPAYMPSLKEIKGQVVSDYQNYLEQQWLSKLKKKYSVKINEKVWQQVRAKYKK